MHRALIIVTRYALAKLAAEPVGQRAEIYHALAELAVTNRDRAALAALADRCHAIDARHERLAGELRRGRRAPATAARAHG